MLLSILSAAAMAAMFLYMICTAKMAETRRVAWVPAAACLVELLALGAITPFAHVGVTLLLIGLRIALLSVCAVAMRRDAAMVRARDRRRAKLARELHAALNPLHEIPAAAAAASTLRTQIA